MCDYNQEDYQQNVYQPDEQWYDNNWQEQLSNAQYTLNEHGQYLIQYNYCVDKHDKIIRELHHQNYLMMETVKAHDKRSKEDIAKLTARVNFLSEEIADLKIELKDEQINKKMMGYNGDVWGSEGEETETEKSENEEKEDEKEKTQVNLVVEDTKEVESDSSNSDWTEQKSPRAGKAQDLTKSTIIGVILNKKTFDMEPKKWTTLHRKICSNIINKFSVEYLIQNSFIKIYKGKTNSKGYTYIQELDVSIQGTNINLTFKDIKNLIKNTKDSMILDIKLNDGRHKKFRF